MLKMRRMVFLILVFTTITYLIVGSLVFHYLEDNNEIKRKKSLAREHYEFLERYPNVDPADLESLVSNALVTHLEGLSVRTVFNRSLAADNITDLEDDDQLTSGNWDIASGFLFCITVISTIGYGHMTPRTWGGQLFCIFYALFGIPIFGAVLVGTGERLQIPIKKLHNSKPWIKGNPSSDQKLKSSLLLSTGMSVIVFIPAWIFTITEDWSYLEGMYYSIITLTTVGFGDLVPVNSLKSAGAGDALEDFLIPKGATATRHYFYRIVLSMWIIMGLSWIALILSEISTMMQSQMNNVAATTQHRLSNLEGLVRKKAKETRQRFSKREHVTAENGNSMAMNITGNSFDDDVTEVDEEHEGSSSTNESDNGVNDNRDVDRDSTRSISNVDNNKPNEENGHVTPINAEPRPIIADGQSTIPADTELTTVDT